MERIEWIKRRSEEIQLEREAAVHELLHGDRPPDPATMNYMIFPNDGLRDEMSDTEYERYLSALGQPTIAAVRRVLTGSPAAQAGLQPNDEIVAYNGERVFSLAELNALTRARGPGNSVVIDVRRDGQTLQLVVPSGPIGIR